MEPLQPLRIADIGLAPRHVLGIARVDKKYGKSPGIEKLENWNPVDDRRFHDDGLDAAFSKPVDQPMQIGREGTEAADWLPCLIWPHSSHVQVAPTSMAAAFGCTIGILSPFLDFDLFGF